MSKKTRKTILINFGIIRRKNDINGNPHATCIIWSDEGTTFFREFDYESEYQAAEGTLRKAIFEFMPTYQNDVNPDFLVCPQWRVDDLLPTKKQIFVLKQAYDFALAITDWKNKTKRGVAGNDKARFFESLGIKKGKKNE